MCSTEAKHVYLSHLFFLSRSRPWPPIQQFCSEPGRYKGPLLLVSCPCTQWLGFTERLTRSNPSLWPEQQQPGDWKPGARPVWAAPEAGSWMLPATGLGQCPCRCRPGPLCYFQPFPLQTSGGDLDSTPDLVAKPGPAQVAHVESQEVAGISLLSS